jgi:hypothetical protein
MIRAAAIILAAMAVGATAGAQTDPFQGTRPARPTPSGEGARPAPAAQPRPAQAPPAGSASVDGAWRGSMRCQSVANQSVVGNVPFTMTVTGGQARFERRIGTSDGRPTENFERGSGTVAPDGTVTLTGGGQGRGEVTTNIWSFSSSYSGRIAGGQVTLQGQQNWQIPRQPNVTRPCTITLSRG